MSNVHVTLEVQYTSSVIQAQGNVLAKEASVVLTAIAAAVDFMDFLIVKLASVILLVLNHFQTDNLSIAPFQMR